MVVKTWETLHAALRQIDASRGKAFEEFVARLFEAETGNRYFLAATGSQPSGDARDDRGGVAIQTKAYFGTTRFGKDEAVAQLQRAIQALPELDIYVLAATKDPAQLRDELAWAEKESGIDVVLLHLGPKLTALSALAVSHWDVVEEFLSITGSDSRIWAQKQRGTAKVRREVEQLRGRLRGAATQVAFQRQSQEILQRRMAATRTTEGTFNLIDLGKAFSRRQIQIELSAWWNLSAPENAVLIGDEGMGKTWVAGEFANELSQQRGKVVLWLDSSSWSAAASVADVLDRALRLILLPGERLFESYRRKILHRWQGPLLIVLDGANESNAWRAAAAILEDYFNHHEQFRCRIRLLFTTRSFSSRSRVASDFWRNSRQLTVGPFSPAELDQALARFAPEVYPNTIEAETREFIRVPMHFRTFLQYKGRLASVRHLDKRLLLWIELEERFSDELDLDPQVAAIRKATNASLSDVLAKLAQTLTWSADGEPTVPMAEVYRCIPAFHEVREDLRAKNIIASNDVDFARLSLDHIILALALLLQREAEKHAAEPLDKLHDLLRARLEPLPSTDDKVRAIHVAVLLSFIRPSAQSGTSARAALLTLWLPQRNANLREEELSFFLAEDFIAYIAAIEWSFQKFLSGDFETTLIAPLARKWTRQGTSFAPLVETLQRWLRLVFPGDSSGSKNRDVSPPADFPVAESEPQLRLSSAAISVISFRPEISLLPALVDCYRSHAFCYQDWTGSGETHRMQVKSAYDHLGVLLRWRFDERDLVVALAKMVHRAPSAGDDVKKICNFARNIRLTSLPSELGPPDDIYQRSGDEQKKSVDYLRAVLGGETGRALNALSFETFARDAIRRDLPALTVSEVHRLAQFAKELLQQHPDKIQVHNTLEQQVFVHLLPWLARYSPAAYHSVLADYVILGAGARNPSDVFIEVDGVPPAISRGPEIINAIFARMPGLLSLATLSGFISEMTEIVLLHGNTQQIEQWSQWLATKPLSRGGGSYVNLLPLPMAFERYATAEFFEVAKGHAALAIESLRQDPQNQDLLHASRHWLHLASYCAPRDQKSAEWAFSTLNSLPSRSELEWPLVYFLLKIADVNVLRRTLKDHRVRHFLDEEDGGFLALRFINNPVSEQLESPEIDGLPISVAGLLYWRRDDEKGLRRWARRLTAAALAFLKTEPPETRVFHRSYRTANDTGLMHGFGIDTPSGGHSQSFYRGSGAWGVDRESQSPTPTEEEIDRLVEEFSNDLDQMRNWAGRQLAGFNAAPALNRWADIEPSVFFAFAESFFAGLESAGIKTYEAMGTIAWCIATAMMKTDPRRGFDVTEQWRTDWSFRVATFGGLATIAVARLWSSECNSSAGIASFRKEICGRALNDEELFVQVLAANRGGTEGEVLKLAKEHLASPHARDRALGVTLLAFVVDANEVGDLVQSVAAGDASYWVRDQAEWAQEALAVELCCRTRYAELLHGPRSLGQIAAGLAELRPALTPLARAWRTSVDDSSGRQFGDDRVATYIELFWYHWESRSESHRDVKIAGRKLKEFCRGEKLKDGVTSRMAPWWT